MNSGRPPCLCHFQLCGRTSSCVMRRTGRRPADDKDNHGERDENVDDLSHVDREDEEQLNAAGDNNPEQPEACPVPGLPPAFATTTPLIVRKIKRTKNHLHFQSACWPALTLSRHFHGPSLTRLAQTLIILTYFAIRPNTCFKLFRRPTRLARMDPDALSSSQQAAVAQLQALTNGGDVEVAIGVLASVDWDVQVSFRSLRVLLCAAGRCGEG